MNKNPLIHNVFIQRRYPRSQPTQPAQANGHTFHISSLASPEPRWGNALGSFSRIPTRINLCSASSSAHTSSAMLHTHPFLPPHLVHFRDRWCLGSSVAPQSTAGRCVVGVDVVEPFSSPSLTAEVGVEVQSTGWKWGKVGLEGDAPARVSRYGSKSCCCSFSRALLALAAARSRAVGGRFVGPE